MQTVDILDKLFIYLLAPTNFSLLKHPFTLRNQQAQHL